MSHEYDPYEAYIDDAFNQFQAMQFELAEANSTEEFQDKLRELNDFMAENPDAFGRNSHFIAPELVENLDVVKGIEKVLTQQHRDSKQSIKRYWWGFVISFALGIIGGLIVAWLAHAANLA